MSHGTGARGRVLDGLIVVAPLAAFLFVMLWLSVERIAPDSHFEGSSSNPVGLLSSNFVYDGTTNLENIVSSVVFIGLVLSYFPRVLRIVSALAIPFLAVAAGTTAELTAISSAYLDVRVCSGSCEFYGMSGVSNALIGFALGAFFLCVILIRARRSRRVVWRPDNFRNTARADHLLLVCAFATYAAALLFFAGLIAIPVVSNHASSSSSSFSTGSSGPSVYPSPPPILVESPPVLLVHVASLLYGVVFFAAVSIAAIRFLHLFAPRESAGHQGNG